MGKRFRTTMMHQAGTDPAQIMQGRVVDVNLNNYTVNVACTFDRKRFFDVQVGSPYLHYANGEGISVMPDVGSQCVVCTPGDSSPPFVLAFLMPHETVTTATDDAPAGTRSHGNTPENPTDASFAGGRGKAKSGDIWFQGRDGNFMRLHRGGVLQIGATELAQRLYIPLSNLVTDISGSYEHFNTGGALTWGIQETQKGNLPAQHLGTYRVFAGDQYADIRIAKGKVFNPVAEPDGGSAMKGIGLGQGDDNPIIFDFMVAPKGFIVPTGDASSSSTPKESVFRFIFDRKGNTLMRCEGQFYAHFSKKVTLDLDDDVVLSGKKTLSFTVKDGMELDGGAYMKIRGKVVLLGPGKTPVALLGSATTSFIQLMQCLITPLSPIPVATPSGPGTIAPGTPITATITIGAPGAPLPIGGQVVTAQYDVKA